MQLTFKGPQHPVHFGKKEEEGDGHRPGRVRRLAAATAAAGMLALVPASVAAADETKPAPGSARFVVGSEGDSFSGQVPDQKGIKNLQEGTFSCVVDGVPNLQSTTFDCSKDEGISKDMKNGAIGGAVLTLILLLAAKAGLKRKPKLGK